MKLLAQRFSPTGLGADEAVATLVAPTPRWREFTVHPGLMDGALQLTLAVLVAAEGKGLPPGSPLTHPVQGGGQSFSKLGTSVSQPRFRQSILNSASS